MRAFAFAVFDLVLYALWVTPVPGKRESKMNRKATVFIVDDDPAIRDQLAALLGLADVEIECCASGEDFLERCAWPPRSCAVVDVDSPGIDGLQLRAELSRRGIPLPIIFLTGHGDIPMSVRAIKAGAFDFIAKPVTASELVASVRAALDESERLNRRIDRMHNASAQLGSLTERERDVLRLAVQGLANKVIARKLGISHRTVEIHRARIMHKTGAETLLDLARLVEDCPGFCARPEA